MKTLSRTHKRRMLFALLWQNGSYCLSRNFRLQRVGNLKWVQDNYNFKVIADAIDELLILNVSRNDTNGQKDFQNFCEALKEVVEGVFVPVAAGGGVLSVAHAGELLASGADKVIVNSALFDCPTAVREIAATYGSQCVVASIDYKWASDGGTQVFKQNGSIPTELTVEQAAELAVSLGAGELYIQSMDRDGTGQGYDLETLSRVVEIVDVPVIAAGGVGGSGHLSDWLSQDRGFAACTANIFNFLGGGLLEARQVVTASNVPLANWEFGWRPGSQ